MKRFQILSLLLAILLCASACSYSTVIQKPEDFLTEENSRVPRIVLNFTQKNIAVGEDFSLIAAISPIPEYLPTFNYNSDNSAVVTVDSTGTVSGVSEGSATINVQSGALVAQCVVTVSQSGEPTTDPTPTDSPSLTQTPTETVDPPTETASPTPTEPPTTTEEFIPIEGLEISGPATCFVSKEYQFEIKVIPENATETYTIHNSNPRCSTLSDDVVLSCFKKDVTTIMVETEDQRISDSLTIHIYNYIEDIKIEAETFTVYEGQTITLSAVFYPLGTPHEGAYWVNEKNSAQKGGKISIRKQEDSHYCTVTGISSGRVMVTAGVNETMYTDMTDSVWITVIPDPNPKIEIEEEVYTLNAGDVFSLPITVKNIDSSLLYALSEEGIITVDAEGNITAHKAGSVTLTVSDENNTASDTVTITVSPIIQLEATEFSLAPGDTASIIASILGAEGTITYQLTEGDIITLSDDGAITANQEGVATITVSCVELDISATVTVTVISPSVDPDPEPTPEPEPTPDEPLPAPEPQE